jgi:serine/threonine protein kinase
MTAATRAWAMQTQAIKKTLDIRREMRLCPECGKRFSRDAAFCPFDGVKLQLSVYDPMGDPLIGATVDGRYEVEELLGEGGMGRVYRVRHASLDRPFAMKVLRRELARDEELCARFIQEAKATGAIQHPHVVHITDFGRLGDGLPYFVMELLVGETLAQVIHAGGPIPAARAARILVQVAGALGAAHAAGVVHRDLKPENVFLVGGAGALTTGGVDAGVASDDVRVVDFGAAKIIGASRLTRTGIVFGTPHYMSPEQASGAPVDHRADIYALGVIMYEMFTGRVPFEADTYMGVLTQHMFVQPVPPSRVCEAAAELGALEDITLVCLAKKPEERYAAMADLVHAIDGVVRVTGEGTAEIAKHLEDRPSRLPRSVRFKMADELEPPSLAEMRVAIDSVLPPKREVPWGWIVGVAAALGGAGIAWLVVREPVAPTAAPAPPVAATASTPVASIPAPPLVSAVTPGPTGPASTSAAPSATAAPTVAVPPPPRPRLPPPPRPPPTPGDVGDPFVNRR